MTTDAHTPDPEALLTAAVGSIADFGNAVGTRWRHIKRGGTYKIVGSCRIEAVNEPAYLYQDEVTGIIWARPMDEFLDGRFEQIEGPWAAQPATCNEGLQVGDVPQDIEFRRQHPVAEKLAKRMGGTFVAKDIPSTPTTGEGV